MNLPKFLPSPVSGSLATGHWYKPDGSLTEEYRQYLLQKGRSPEKIEQMNEIGRRERKFEQELQESLKAHAERCGGRRNRPNDVLRDRAIARSTQPPWSLISEGEVEPDEVE